MRKPGMKSVGARAAGLLEGARAVALGRLGLQSRLLDRRAQVGGRLVVLGYHSVVEGRADRKGIEVARKHFEGQMRFLRSRFPVVPLEAAVTRLQEGNGGGPVSVAVTFDDGYRSLHDVAFPVLRDLGIPASVFLTTRPVADGSLIWTHALRRAIERSAAATVSLPELGEIPLSGPREKKAAAGLLVRALKQAGDDERVAALGLLFLQAGRPATGGDRLGMLSPEQVGFLSRSGLFTFESHTATHPTVSRLSEDALERELAESMDCIRQWTGRNPVLFAYPNGGVTDFDAKSGPVLRRHGFRAAFTLVRGVNDRGTDRYAMRRIPVKDGGLARFIDSLIRHL